MKRFRIIALISSLLAGGLAFAPAQTVIRFPQHDWTVRLGGKVYGLVEYGRVASVPRMSSYTVMLWGNHQRSVNVSIFVVAAVPIIAFALTSFLATRILARLGSAHGGGEEEDRAPT